ncbi:MAG: hypothetical protein U0X76_02020 [Bacteroidia bacterium]
MKRHLFRFSFPGLLLLMFFSCKKENDNPQWDVQVLGPIAHTTLTLDQITGKEHTVAGTDDKLSFRYDTIIGNLSFNSIYQVPDTTIPTVVLFPPFSAILNPGTPFSSNSNNVEVGANGVYMKKAIIGSGTIRIQVKNSLRSKVHFTYTIPKATKNGVPFAAAMVADSGSTATPVTVTQDFDFSGYTIDLTGTTGGAYNTVSYNVEARADSFGYPFPVNASDTIINLNATLIGITPVYAKGYLGQSTISDAQDIDIGIGGIWQSGTLALESATMDIDFTNYIGADIQAHANLLSSYNANTANTVALTGTTFIGQAININRASEPFPGGSGTGSISPTVTSIHLDNSNSNIKALVENLPDLLSYNVDLKLNPLGNISGYNDFVYSDKLVSSHLLIDVPLKMGASDLLLVDTTDLNINGTTDLSSIGTSTITMVAKNSFPFDVTLQMFLLDENYVVIDSLFSPDLIRSGTLDGNYIVTSATETRIKIPVPERKRDHLQQAKQLVVHALFNTMNYPQTIQLYKSYHLDLKFIADGIYSIR